MKYRTESRAISGRAAGLLGILLVLLLAIGMDAGATNRPPADPKQEQEQQQGQGQEQGLDNDIDVDVDVRSPGIIINNTPGDGVESLPDRLDISTTPTMTAEGDYSDYKSLALSSNLPANVPAPAVGGHECLEHRPGIGFLGAGKTGHTRFDDQCMCLKGAEIYLAAGHTDRAAAHLDKCLGLNPTPVNTRPGDDQHRIDEKLDRIYEQALKK